jgi:hypothetical protein
MVQTCSQTSQTSQPTKTVYYKITNEKENHHGYQYKDGLNVLDKPFETTGSCVVGGLYFTTKEYIHHFLDYGGNNGWLREITLPDDALMVQDSETSLVKYRADKIILGKRMPLYCKETVQECPWIITKNYCNNGLEYACCNGHLDIAKYMVECGANNFNNGLYYACIKGHLDIAKYMVECGGNNFNTGLRHACSNGHLDIAKYMVECGANDFNNGLFNACYNGHLELAKYMVESGANDFNDGLYNACYNGHLDIVKYMVECGAIDFNDGLYNACRNGHLEIQAYLKTLIK